jgi:parallel beta-helix repeat protein
MGALNRSGSARVAIAAALVIGAVVLGTVGGNGASRNGPSTSPLPALQTPWARGGPTPSGGSPTCPGPSSFTGQIVIWTNGTILPKTAPLTKSGSTYRVEGSFSGSVLDLASNITLDGSGCGLAYATVGGYGNLTGVEVRNATEVTAEYFDITGTFDYGVEVDHASSVSVFDCSAESAANDGLLAESAADVNLTGNNVSYSGNGAYFQAVSDGLAEGNQMVGAVNAALYDNSGTDIAFVDNNGRNSGNDGAYVVSDEDTLLSGNNLSGTTSSSGYGVYSDFSTNDVFTGNNLRGDEDYGVYAQNLIGSVAIEHNQITGGMAYGVDIEDSLGGPVAISNNDIQNATKYGVYLDNPCAAIVAGNDISANATTSPLDPTGVYADAANGPLSISDNDLAGGYDHGVDIDSAGAPMSVTGNVVANATDFGISASDSYGLTVANNDVSVNATTKGYGIYLYEAYGGSAPTVVRDNDATGGWEYAVYFYETYTPVEVADNNCGNATIDGITYYELNAPIDVIGNNLAANSTTGLIDHADGLAPSLLFTYLEGAVLTDNNFANAWVGLDLSDSYGAVSVTNDSFANDSSYGIEMDSTMWGNVSITGNTFSQTRLSDDLYGAYVGDVDGDFNFSDNVVTGAVEDGLESAATTGLASLFDNQFHDPVHYGASVSETYGGFLVRGNSFLGNGSSLSAAAQGLFLDDTIGSTVSYVSDNTVSGGLGVGIELDEAEGALSVLANNSVSSTVKAGIWDDSSYAPVLIVNNTVSTARGTDVLVYDSANVSVEANELRDANVSLNVSSIDGPTEIVGNNDTHSNLSLVVSSSTFSYLTTISANDFSDSRAAFVNSSWVVLRGNDFLGTPAVDFLTDTFDAFYHNDIWTGSGSSFDLAGSAPALGSYNAPPPVGGNFWTGYTPTTCTAGLCSPPYDVPSLGTPTGVYDNYPLGSAWVNYAVTFTESGLPVGTAWSVRVGASVLMGVSPAPVEFFPENVPPATYDYSVPGVGAYTNVAPASGTFLANGHALTIPIIFAAPSYPVVFAESGIAVGASWYVNSTGAPSFADMVFTVTSSGNQMFALGNLSNGTYAYSVAVGAPYYATSSPAAGSFTVNGAGATVTYAYVYTPPVYSVTFAVSGLPSGSSWTVTLAGSPLSGTGGTLSTSESNGVYAFQITGPSGYRFSPASGSVTVAGGSVSVFVVATPSVGSSTNNAGISTPAFYALLAALVAALALAGVGWTMYARRPKGGSPTGSGAPPPGAAGMTPGSAGAAPSAEAPPSPPPPTGGEGSAP